MDVEVPEWARMVLLQEDKFKAYYNKLSVRARAVRGRRRRLMPIAQPLLKPHLRRHGAQGPAGLVNAHVDVDEHRRLPPPHPLGGSARLDDLVAEDPRPHRQPHRAQPQGGLQPRLVELPNDESFILDKFVSVQEKHVKEQARRSPRRTSRSRRRSPTCSSSSPTYQLEGGGDRAASLRARGGAGAARALRRMLYRAVLNATKRALHAIKKRVGSRASGGFLFLERPFFDVDVELTIPHVSMTPTLDDIQAAINRCCALDPRASRRRSPCGRRPRQRARAHDVFDELARDKEIVKMVLLLTGSVEGAKRQVFEYLETFSRYDWLWKDNKEAEYAAFMREGPSLEDFEAELKKYVDIEREIQKIAPVHNIGALSLETAPLKYSLKLGGGGVEGAVLRRTCTSRRKAELDATLAWMEDMQKKLKREIRDLDNVRAAMGYLAEVREKEGAIEQLFGPVEEMYAMLGRYEVRVSKEEADTGRRAAVHVEEAQALPTRSDDGRAASPCRATFKKRPRAQRQGVRRRRQRLPQRVGGQRADRARHHADAGRVERLQKFKRMYDDARAQDGTSTRRARSSSGCRSTDYPELTKTKKEIDLLEKVYSLYIDVITTVDEYKEMLWTDVPDGEIEDMQAKMGEFQNACKKMPKALREYEAFVELKRLIDDFLETLPLVQQLAHPSMRARHWTALMEATKAASSTSARTRSSCRRCSRPTCSSSARTSRTSPTRRSRSCRSRRSSRHRRGLGRRAAHVRRVQEPRADHAQGRRDGRADGEGRGDADGLGSMLASRYVAPFKEEVQRGSPSSRGLRRCSSSGCRSRRCGSTSRRSSPRATSPSSCRRRASASPASTRTGRRSCRRRSRRATSSSTATATTCSSPTCCRTCSSSSRSARRR